MEEVDDPSFQLLETTRFWIQRVFVPIMVCIGVGGNTITVIVLTRKRMRCSTNIYLTALAIADIVYLLFVFFLSFQAYKNIHDGKYELYWRFYGLTVWLCDAASSSSVWLTVSFTVERYIAVCHPIKGKLVCTESRAKMIIVIVAFFCLTTTISTAFEYQLDVQNVACIRNCTPEEMKHMNRSSDGNSFQNFTIHYLPDHNLVVTNFQNNENAHASAKFVKEIYTNLNPVKNQLLPNNCTSHPHIIYVPFVTTTLNKTSPNKYNDNIIDKQVNNKSEVTEQRAENTTIEEHMENITAMVDKLNNTNILENGTCCAHNFTVAIVSTELGKNTIYKTYMQWYSALSFGLIPLIMIATFNCLLVRAVYRSQTKRRKMTNSQENTSMSNENRITVMLIGVVILFLICQTPTASFLIYSNLHEPNDKATEHLHRAIGNIFNLLLTINASCNFIMYCVLSNKYRTTFRVLFCGFRKRRQDTLVLSSTIRSVRNSQRFNNSYNNGLRRNISEYQTPRNLETQSLTSFPRSKSLMARPPGKAKSTDMNI